MSEQHLPELPITFVTMDDGTTVAIERGSGNVFADLGFEHPEDELAKAELAITLSRIIKGMRITQRDAAARIGVSQPMVSKLLRGRTEGLSSDRLLRMISCLRHDIQIVVKPSESPVGKIEVLLEH